MDADDAYANGRYIAGAEAYPPRWRAEAAAFRAALGPRALCGIAYGPSARQRLDLFRPEGTPRGLMLFVHGGYWRSFGRADWSHLAAGGVGRGWAVAVPGYTLAPEASIAAITREIAAAARRAAALVPGPVVAAGHSAGGHLVARLACADVAATPRLVRVAPISPLGDLRPLMATAMNADFRLDEAAALAESPALQPLRAGIGVRVRVGADERPAFLAQAEGLARAWGVPCDVAPGLHHFDVIDDLARPESPLMAWLTP